MKKLLSVVLAVAMVMALSATAFAAEFVGSVGAESDVTAIGNVYVYNADGSVAEEFIGAKLVITNYADKDKSNVHDDIEAMLENAAKMIIDAIHLGHLTHEKAEALKELQDSTNDPAIAALSVEDFVVRDLFDVSLVKDNQILKLAPGQVLEFSLKTHLIPGEVFFLLHNYNGDWWEVVDDVTLMADGTLKIKVTGTSPFAITVPSERALLDTKGITSPNTGVAFGAGEMFAAVVVLGAVSVAAVKSKKR